MRLTPGQIFETKAGVHPGGATYSALQNLGLPEKLARVKHSSDLAKSVRFKEISE